jgi:3-oxoacyl-[acyl-carrier-protein] synthase II
MKPAIDVVVTGMGVVSPIGTGVEAFWQSLQAGRSGISVREPFRDTDMPWRIGGAIRDFDGKEFVKPRKSLKVMCPQIQYGYAAAQMAVEQSGLTPDQYDPNRLGTVFGSETFYADPEEVAEVFRKCIVDQRYEHARWGEYSMRDIMPLWMLKYLPNMVASHISIAYDARGPSNTICQAEVSGQLALIEAVDLIRRGAADAVIVGGTGSPMETTSLLYRGWSRLSRRIHEPERASRPFDAHRDGIVMGEGAGAIVIEREEFARARNAHPLARIRGMDRRAALLQPDSFVQNIAESIRATLQNSERSASDLSHVNANGLSTVVEDAFEAQAIRASLGDLPVFAPKSYFGNLGPGTSIVEMIASICAQRQGHLPATLNYEHPDPNCPANVQASSLSINSAGALLLSFASTGQIATVLID